MVFRFDSIVDMSHSTSRDFNSTRLSSAAAYSQSNQHEKAVEDARKALEIDANYSKAYSRLGLALYSLGDFSEAVDAYEKGLKLDPTNATMKQQLQAAKDKAKSSSSSVADAAPAATAPGGGGLPGLGGLDFNSIMGNPAFAQMAQQVMQNPEMLNSMMNNPMLQK